MLKCNSQTEMNWKGLGVGENEECKDLHEKDWKESPKRLWLEGREPLSVS